MAQTKIGNCEVCPKTEVTVTLRHHSIWFCDECWAKEEELQKVNTSPQAVAARIEAAKHAANPADILKVTGEVDNRIETRTDLFNAATVAILDIKKAIDEDASIVNKPYALAEQLKARFEHYKNVVFELNQQLVEAGNQQRAIQVYLNNLANQLRAEEREKLKIQDINYRPNPVKQPTVKKISTVGTKKKATNKEISQAAKELGIAEFTLKAFILQSGGDLEVAVNKIKKSIEAAKQA